MTDKSIAKILSKVLWPPKLASDFQKPRYVPGYGQRIDATGPCHSPLTASRDSSVIGIFYSQAYQDKMLRIKCADLALPPQVLKKARNAGAPWMADMPGLFLACPTGLWDFYSPQKP
jgi:hypothetical protein